MNFKLYEVTFVTKKGGEYLWLRTVRAFNRQDAIDKVKEYWNEGPLSGLHMFGVRARLVDDSAASADRPQDFRVRYWVRDYYIRFAMSDDGSIRRLPEDHGGPYTFAPITGANRFEVVETDDGPMCFPSIIRKAKLWSVTDRNGTRIAYDWEVM